MPIQIDGKTVGAMRLARDDGSLATVGEARVWDGAWKVVWQGMDAIERLNPRHYYQLNGSWVDYMGNRNLSVNSSRASVGSEFATFNNYSGSRYAEITNLPSGSTGDSYTIAMWARPTSSASNYPAFFARGTGSSNAIDVYYSGAVYFDGGSDNTGTTISAPYVLNQWQHYVMRITHDTTSRTGVELWYNGEPMGTSTFSAGSRHSSSDSMKIGSAAGGNYPFRGDMDTIAYFDRALTNAEVLSIYNAGRL